MLVTFVRRVVELDLLEPGDRVELIIGAGYATCSRGESRGATEELETLLRKITEETQLIHADNLARGDFVRTASVSMNRTDQTAPWRVAVQSLHSPSSATDPAEYWAGKPLSFGDDFLTDTASFPVDAGRHLKPHISILVEPNLARISPQRAGCPPANHHPWGDSECLLHFSGGGEVDGLLT
jgi:hypothetical protein